jgi:hypothetical protein
MILGQTKNTLGDILKWLERVGTDRPDDQAYVLDLMNVISHHVKLIAELKKVNALTPDGIAHNVNDVLFSK